jgi:regulator of protease activity HflC (stomatin/prohibitin superfamily)
MHPLTIVLSILTFPLTLIGSWLIVNPQEEKVILSWGSLARVLREPGLYFVPFWGRAVITVSTKQQTMDIHRTQVADANGNPIQIAGVCTYQVVDAPRAALAVEHHHEFVKIQAMAVLKQIAAKYPYEAPDGHSLKAEAEVISREMVDLLQARVLEAGVRIIGYALSDLSYAPEIAQAMLVRQQAQAMVGARRIIVEGAVSIALDTVEHLRAKGMVISQDQQQQLVSNLLVVICGDSKVHPTYQTNPG